MHWPNRMALDFSLDLDRTQRALISVEVQLVQRGARLEGLTGLVSQRSDKLRS